MDAQHLNPTLQLVEVVVEDGEAAQRLRVMPAHQQRMVMKLMTQICS